MFIGGDQREKILDKYKEFVSRGKVELYTQFGLDLIAGKRSGVILEDVDGRKFYNVHCNGGVFNLGHRNPEIIQALKEALEFYDIGNHHLISAPRALLAEKLAETFPGDLNKVVYNVGGGEAIDLAIKLVRGYSGRMKIIYAKGAYHGHTGLALAAGEEKFKKPFLGETPDFIPVEFGNIEDVVANCSEEVAAVIFETIPATGGIKIPPPDFFSKVKKLCEEKGVLFIIDEVQTGFGRTGKLWGFQHFDFIPDIVVIGKGMSGGIYPITAVIYREPLETFFLQDPFIHISTFGGSELGCFVAMKVLEISSREEFLDNVNRQAEIFKEGIMQVMEEVPGVIVEFRQLGLMMGLKIKDEMSALIFLKNLFDNGVYTVYSGNDPSVIQFLPPLIIRDDESKEVIERVKKTTKSVKEIIG